MEAHKQNPSNRKAEYMKNGSILTRKQAKSFGPRKCGNGYIIAEVRHDDECGNGYNSFAITAEIYEPHHRQAEASITQNGKQYWLSACGCCHDEVIKAFPELAPYIRWHLSDTDGPMHYSANALYWAGHCGYRDGKPNSPPNLEHLKITIVYGALENDSAFPLESFIYDDAAPFTANDFKKERLVEWLTNRLERLQAAFRADVEKLGFVW